MSHYRRTYQELLGLAEDTGKDLSIALAAQRKTLIAQKVESQGTQISNIQAKNIQYDQNLAAFGIGPDTGAAPAAPAGLTATPFARAVAVSWTPPPLADMVNHTEVRVFQGGTLLRTVTTSDKAGTIIENLPASPLTIDARFINQYNRASAYAAAISVTPNPSAADQLTMTTGQFATQYSTLLNDPNLAALTDPGKLADGVVRSASLLAAQGANLLRWDEAEFENYPAGAFTLGISPANQSMSVVAAGDSRKWLSLTGPGIFYPFLPWRDRTGGEAGDYIISFDANNTSAAAVTVQAGRDTSESPPATNQQVFGPNFTVPPGVTTRVWMRITRDPNRPNIRFMVQPSAAILVSRFMLQKVATAQTEPGPYRPPALSAGIVSAQLLATWDLAATRAVLGSAVIEQAKIANAAIGNAQLDKASVNKISILGADIASATITSANIAAATITSANIANLTVDKLQAGSFVGGAMTLTNNGYLVAGPGCVLYGGGLALGLAGSYDTAPVDASYKVSSNPAFAELMFYSNTNTAADGNYRGVVIRSDGVSGGVHGAVVLHANPAGALTAGQSGRIEAVASPSGGKISLYDDVTVARNLVANGNFNAGGNVSAGSAFSGNSINVTGEVAGGSWAQNFICNSSAVPAGGTAVYSPGYLARISNFWWAGSIEHEQMPSADGKFYVHFLISTNQYKIYNTGTASRTSFGYLYR